MSNKRGIKVELVGNYGVIMDTSMEVKGKGVCRGVHLHIGGLEIDEFLPLELGGVDVILGM